ncbi:PLP-dependent transferase [Marinicella rhabdoformis]|uniref:PLP-dependent transferase n=1 Tax=Marinicella rhabdoformis TaxID=2580566 RepID=UPI0012AEDBDB|nr:PLP-dependent transferase [Marinicella rhabdoformis]
MNSITTIFDSIKKLLKSLPQDWLKLTTHRLDIYNESEAKSEFLHELKALISQGKVNAESLAELPTAYDYIRLGHQLSSVLEWVLAEINQVPEAQVIAFASKTMPILAVLRKQAIKKQPTYIYYDGNQSPLIDETRLKNIYGYQYELIKVASQNEVPAHENAFVVFVTEKPMDENLSVYSNINATVNLHQSYGAYMVVHQGSTVAEIVSEIVAETVAAVQHVRRRESIAMSPLNCFNVLKEMVGFEAKTPRLASEAETTIAQDMVAQCIRDNTGSESTPLVASSGLSIQYAILMGLVEAAMSEHPDKPIKIILPPNCYGGTNDQSRRVADLIPQVGIVDLLVDGGADLVNSLETALASVAADDGVPIVLAEIPTNPRVEVPDMVLLGQSLSKKRQNAVGEAAVEPTFMVDQTFCPNVKLLHDESELVNVKTISFSSGSKFPSGGRCIAGYCAANQAADALMPIIASHLSLSDNQADTNQLNILAETMPSMPERIVEAYKKTHEFVSRIKALLPESKMFYVTDEIAERGFMPSVFSLDLPVKGASVEEKQAKQIELNKKFIQFMIEQHPESCKNCVSYGQLKGSYWTIPATSTQGTTKEDDKDYVVRASLAPDVNVDMLMASFEVFCRNEGLASIL